MNRALLALIAALALTVPQLGAANAYDDYKKLTPDERRLALRYFWQLPGVKRASDFAVAEAARRFGQYSGQDDPRDAFRHGTWNGGMVRRLKSARAAERWGNAHEEWAGNPASRKLMDLTNNQTGRDMVWSARTRTGPWWWRKTVFPGDAQIADAVEQAVLGGRLVMVEEVGGARDPHAGALVPTR